MSVRSFTSASFIAISLAVAGCHTAPAAAPAAEHVTAKVPIGTVKELMKGIVDPNSAALWDAVGSEETPKGTVEKAPKTDEDWAKLSTTPWCWLKSPIC